MRCTLLTLLLLVVSTYGYLEYWREAEFPDASFIPAVYVAGSACSGSVGDVMDNKYYFLVKPAMNGWSLIEPGEIPKPGGTGTNYYFMTVQGNTQYTIFGRFWAWADGTSAFHVRIRNGFTTSMTTDPFFTWSPVGVARWTWDYEQSIRFTSPADGKITIALDRGSDLMWVDKFVITTDTRPVPTLPVGLGTVVIPNGFPGPCTNFTRWNAELENQAVFPAGTIHNLKPYDDAMARGLKSMGVADFASFSSQAGARPYIKTTLLPGKPAAIAWLWVRAMCPNNDSNEIYVTVSADETKLWQLSISGSYLWNKYDSPLWMSGKSNAIDLVLELKEPNILIDSVWLTATDDPVDAPPSNLWNLGAPFLDLTKDYMVASVKNFSMPSVFTVTVMSYWSDVGFPQKRTKTLFQFAGTDGLLIGSDANGFLYVKLGGYNFRFDVSPIVNWKIGSLYTLTITWDGTSLKVYDGATLLGTKTATSTLSLPATGLLTIGQPSTVADGFGQIDRLQLANTAVYEIRVWNSVLTSGFTSAIPDPLTAPNLYALWDFHEDNYYTVSRGSVLPSGYRMEAIPSEWRALLNLYHSNGGPTWKSSANWTSSQTPCKGGLPKWYGIFCDQHDRVTILNLAYNNVSGILPENKDIPFLIGLPHMKYLFLHNNEITGPIPSYFKNCPNLTHLYLYSNRFTGTVPPELGEMPKILKLYMSYNQLTGTIPDVFHLSPTLQYLEIGFNKLNGTLPTRIALSTSLKLIDFQNNTISGPLPFEIVNCHIATVQLRSNLLLGEIPERLTTNDTGMSLMDFSWNDLSCYLPDWLKNKNITFSVRLEGLWFWCPINVAPSVIGASCVFPKVQTVVPSQVYVQDYYRFPDLELNGYGFMAYRCAHKIRIYMEGAAMMVPHTITETLATSEIPWPHEPGQFKVRLVWNDTKKFITNYQYFTYIKGCLNNCFSNATPPHGFCVDNIKGICMCNPQYEGEDCSWIKCPANCSGHGDCNHLTGVCSCYAGWTGSACSIPTYTCPDDCKVNGNYTGTCDYRTGKCRCFSGWWGLSGYCNWRICPPGIQPFCNSDQTPPHGYCNTTTGNCTCYSGFLGRTCEFAIKNCSFLNNCNGPLQGACNPYEGTCICKSLNGVQYGGPDCSWKLCPKNCSGHGVCNYTTGVCMCDVNYRWRPDCSVRHIDCPGVPMCSGAGRCNYDTGMCICDDGRTGSICDQYICPGTPECSGNGDCNRTTGRCTCDEISTGFYSGYMCDVFNTYCPGVPMCSGVGYCDLRTGLCSCPPNRRQPDCLLYNCPGNPECSDHGNCDRNTGLCICDYVAGRGWTGLDCSIPRNNCTQPCNNGYCNMLTGECVCTPGYGPPPPAPTVCFEKPCPMNCTPPNGVCNTLTGQCVCNPGWSGIDCSVPYITCPVDCGSHGFCDYKTGNCQCAFSYFGDHCQFKNCTLGCFGHGTCDFSTGLCVCDPNWNAWDNCKSSNCETHLYCLSRLNRGTCDTSLGTCNCNPPYFGDSCQYSLCPDNCTNHGTCDFTTGRCNCSRHSTGTYAGLNCSLKYIDCPNGCSGHGDCNRFTGVCTCQTGWLLPDCAKLNCTTCVHGTCVWPSGYRGVCQCDPNWVGSACDVPYLMCPMNCSLKGVCDHTTGNCSCLGLSLPPDCSTFSCPSCTIHGHCNTTTGKCDCDFGYSGVLCQTSYFECPMPCDLKHGVCNTQMGNCTCRYPWVYNSVCSEALCMPDCVTGQGVCNHTTGLCECVSTPDYRFTGVDCRTKVFNCIPSCVNGMCDTSSGLCLCDNGYFGKTCELKKCPSDCNHHGTCDNLTGICSCDLYYSGLSCSIASLPCPNNCTGPAYGNCNPTTGVCFCLYPHISPPSGPADCSLTNCMPSDCSGHGSCDQSTGTCSCDQYWTGTACNIPNKPCPNACSGHGYCNRTSGICRCWVGYSGDDCSKKMCPNNCTKDGVVRGTCDETTGICHCFAGFIGASCNLRLCPNNCTNTTHGICNAQTGNCTCLAPSPDEIWGGIDCSERLCYNECGGVGDCNSGVCDCKLGYTGKYCEKENWWLIIVCACGGAVVLVGAATAGFLLFRHHMIKKFEAARRDRMKAYQKQEASPFSQQTAGHGE